VARHPGSSATPDPLIGNRSHSRHLGRSVGAATLGTPAALSRSVRFVEIAASLLERFLAWAIPSPASMRVPASVTVKARFPAGRPLR